MKVVEFLTELVNSIDAKAMKTSSIAEMDMMRSAASIVRYAALIALQGSSDVLRSMNSDSQQETEQEDKVATTTINKTTSGSKSSSNYWASMTPEQRRVEIKRRRKVAIKNRNKKVN